jgi:hypothetical protein
MGYGYYPMPMGYPMMYPAMPPQTPAAYADQFQRQRFAAAMAMQRPPSGGFLPPLMPQQGVMQQAAQFNDMSANNSGGYTNKWMQQQQHTPYQPMQQASGNTVEGAGQRYGNNGSRNALNTGVRTTHNGRYARPPKPTTMSAESLGPMSTRDRYFSASRLDMNGQPFKPYTLTDYLELKQKDAQMRRGGLGPNFEGEDWKTAVCSLTRSSLKLTIIFLLHHLA